MNKIQEKETELNQRARELNGLPEGHPERVPLRRQLAALQEELAALRQEKVVLLKLQNAQGVRACMVCTLKVCMNASKSCCAQLHTGWS